jgi:SAM-dependent methyltransferase
MTGSVETFQLSVEAAEAYEARFVPAIFAEWAPHLVEAAGVVGGQAVLDVACGTGVVARAAAGRMAGRGRVVGLDINEGMLAVARRLRPDIEWRQGDAAELPFEPGSFDVVLCQAALMFFPDRAAALGEMARVATDGGVVAVQVWDRLEAQAGFGAMYEAFTEHLGPAAAALESSYWVLGDLGLVGVAVRGRRPGGHRHPDPRRRCQIRLGRGSGRDRDRGHAAGGTDRPGLPPADPGGRHRGDAPVRGRWRPGRAAHRGPPDHRGQGRLIAPYPPPPGVMTVTTSPASSGRLVFGGSSRPLHWLRPTAPGLPPSRPCGR